MALRLLAERRCLGDSMSGVLEHMIGSPLANPAGCFTADPGLGYPPGTPSDTNAVSWHGILHLISASVAFLALTAAGCVWTRRFVAQGRGIWAAYSAISVLIFFASFAGLASGHLSLNLAFVLTALNAFVWAAVVAAQLAARSSGSST